MFRPADWRSADDSDRPQIWIELGGQFEPSRRWAGSHLRRPSANSPARLSICSPSQKFERPPPSASTRIGKISFQPEDSDWIFSASIRYGRSHGKSVRHQQTYPNRCSKFSYFSSYRQQHWSRNFNSAPCRQIRRHKAANRKPSHSRFPGRQGCRAWHVRHQGWFVGTQRRRPLRAIQPQIQHRLAIRSGLAFQYTYFTMRPAYHIKFSTISTITAMRHRTAKRSFHGVGPSISWNASAPLAGNSQDGELTFDWGVNARTAVRPADARSTHHQTTARLSRYNSAKYHRSIGIAVQAPVTRTHRATSPCPISAASRGCRSAISNAKISLGYRADFFFGAIDGGIDTRKTENRGFYRPLRQHQHRAWATSEADLRQAESPHLEIRAAEANPPPFAFAQAAPLRRTSCRSAAQNHFRAPAPNCPVRRSSFVS